MNSNPFSFATPNLISWISWVWREFFCHEGQEPWLLLLPTPPPSTRKFLMRVAFNHWFMSDKTRGAGLWWVSTSFTVHLKRELIKPCFDRNVYWKSQRTDASFFSLLNSKPRQTAEHWWKGDGTTVNPWGFQMPVLFKVNFPKCNSSHVPVC